MASVEAYDPATNTWREKAPLPAALEGMGRGLNGILYVTGGSDAYTVQSSLYAYDASSNSWTSKALCLWDSPPEVRRGKRQTCRGGLPGRYGTTQIYTPVLIHGRQMRPCLSPITLGGK